VATLPAFATTAVTVPPIDEVLVTVKRRASSLRDISMPVSLVAGEDVQTQKILTDALSAISGVFLQQTTPGQGAAIVRGLKGSAVLHLVDGIRLNNAIFRSAPTQYLALVPTSGIERLEVIRGTPTSLYGSDAIGGVVQVITRIPKFDSENFDVRADAMVSFDTAEDGQMLNATLDFGNRRYAASLSGEYRTTGDRRIGGGDVIKPSAYDAKAVRMLLFASPTTGKSWLLDLHYLEQPHTPRVDELVPGYGQTLPSSAEFAFKPNERAFVHLRRTSDAGVLGLDWTTDLAWQRIVDDRSTRDLGSADRIEESNSSDLSALTISASQNSDTGSWVVGADLYHDRVRSSRSSTDIETLLSQQLAPRFPDDSTIQQFALYGNVDRQLTDRQLMSVGVRYSSVGIKLPSSAGVEATDLDVNDLSGDIGWVYELSESSQLFANVGYGFRAPNIFDLGSLGSRPGNRFNIPNTSLNSEHVVQGDFGLRVQRKSWDAEVAFFALDYDDRITPALTGDLTSSGRDVVQSVNAANATLRGAELELNMVFANHLSARVLLNYTRGDQSMPDIGNEPADRIPPLNGRLQIMYGSGRAWQLDGWLNFAAKQERLSARDIRDVRVNPDGTSGWGTVGLRVLFDTADSWRFSLGLDNVLDKKYRTHGSGIDGVGRNLSVNIRKTWP
jgi:hemoglobin/transferrin/lactoferrin receptor protein